MWQSILDGCAWLLYQLSNIVGDWGLAIIIVTLIIRLALFPVQRKQFASTYKMKEVQPKIQRIQEIYAGDQQKISEETMKIYRETGFNPMAGCLPMLIQMPVFIILFQTLRYKLVDYADIGNGVTFYNILPDLTQTMAESGYSIAYVITALLFIAFSVSPMILQLKNSPSEQRNQTYMMLAIMGIMFIWMAFISPGGVMLYWALSSAFGFFQQLIQNKRLDKEGEEREAEIHRQQVEVHVERKQKKKRQHRSR